MYEIQGSLQFFFSDEIYNILDELIRTTRQSIWIATANLKDVFVKRGRNFRPLISILAEMSLRGIDVRFIYSGEPSSRFREEVEGLEHKIKFSQCIRNHIKAVIVDDRSILIGSANFTGAGLGMRGKNKRNFEVAFLSKNKILIEKISEIFYNIFIGTYCQDCKLKKFCEDIK